MQHKDLQGIYVRPATATRIKELATRDARPVWALIKDAVAYYEKVHAQARTPPATPFPKRGRPPKAQAAR